MAVDVEGARSVVLDLAERCAEVETELAERLSEAFSSSGGVVPPKGHAMRSDFEAWAERAGCRTRAGLRAPTVNGKALFRLPEGRWVETPNGRSWVGEVVTWEDGGYSGAGGQNVDDWGAWLDRTAADITVLFDLRRFVAHLPTNAELEAGWSPPSWLPLEEHEAAILAGTDVETGLPLTVAEWLAKLLHEPKREYAAAYCSHRLFGDPEPEDPRTPWAAKARKRADRVLEAA